MNTPFRVGLAKDFPNTDPVYLYTKTLEDCKQILKWLGVERQYQSQQFPIHGLRNLAIIEHWDEDEQDWFSWIED